MLIYRPAPLGFAQYGTNLVLTWSAGTLQSAPAATGAYTAVSGATSPYINSVSGGTKFYRLQIQ